MNYKVRVLPTRDVLMKTAEAAPIPFSPEAPALVLNLINAGYLINQEIISYMENEFGISEGKFVLLMALKTIPKGCSIKELAARVGVSVPTISVMLSRMRAQTHPHEGRRSRKAGHDHEGRTRAARSAPPGAFQARDGLCRTPDAGRTERASRAAR